MRDRTRPPRLRARKVVVALSSRDGIGEAMKSLRTALGKKRRPIMVGRLTKASRANAVWMMEGMVGAVMVQRWVEL